MHLSGFTYMNFLRLRFSFIYLFNAPQKVGTGHFHDRFISYFLYLNLRKLSAAKKKWWRGGGQPRPLASWCYVSEIYLVWLFTILDVENLKDILGLYKLFHTRYEAHFCYLCYVGFRSFNFSTGAGGGVRVSSISRYAYRKRGWF